MKKWKLKIIHLSHTDIGDKDIQKNILNNHVNFFKNIIKKTNFNNKLMNEWTIPYYYILELFWERSYQKHDTLIKKYIKEKLEYIALPVLIKRIRGNK